MKQNRRYIAVLILLAGPFYVNDLASIYVKSWQWWLFIDYTAVKLFPFLVVVWLLGRQQMQPCDFGFTAQRPRPFFLALFIAALAGTLIDQNAYQLLEKFPGYPPLGGMPAIKSPIWDWIDLTFGLLVVGVFEELVFRGFMQTFLSRYTKSAATVVVISAAAFGLAHWGNGLHAVLITAVIGAVFMTVYLATRSLPALMLAHFVVNFIDFAGVVPKAVFKFY